MDDINKITCENLILCEGVDEKLFFIWYLNSNERKVEDSRFGLDVEAFDFGGNEDLPAFLKVLKNVDGFHNVKSIMIVRDAEKKPDVAINQIKSALEAADLPVPNEPAKWVDDNSGLFVSYILLPKMDQQPVAGTLEDLCIDIIKNDYRPEEVFGTVDRYLDELDADGLRKYSHRFKTRLHSFLSVTDPFVGMKVGESAKAGAFDWSSERFYVLNDMFREIFDK